MKVYKIHESDYIYAENELKAIEYYQNCFNSDEIEHDDIEEVDINVIKMMYVVDNNSIGDITTFMSDHPKEKFECGYDNREGFLVIWLKLSEVFEIEKPTEPYIICSTEY